MQISASTRPPGAWFGTDVATGRTFAFAERAALLTSIPEHVAVSGTMPLRITSEFAEGLWTNKKSSIGATIITLLPLFGHEGCQNNSKITSIFSDLNKIPARAFSKLETIVDYFRSLFENLLPFFIYIKHFTKPSA